MKELNCCILRESECVYMHKEVCDITARITIYAEKTSVSFFFFSVRVVWQKDSNSPELFFPESKNCWLILKIVDTHLIYTSRKD